MKSLHIILITLIFSGITILSQAQGVGINGNESSPDPSAGLDVNFTDKGFLPPRMTTAQRNSIPSPAEGLMIYNTEEKTVNIYNGSSWGLLSSFICGQPFSDPRDGRIYTTVLIGTQCWMAQNLNTGARIDGVNNQSDNGIPEKYCFNDLESGCDDYGGLYQWNEVMQYSTIPGSQGICPTGWHVPTDAEWCTLTTYLDASVNCSALGVLSGTDAGGKMKEAGNTHWASPNTGATNSSGFTGLPGGMRHSSGSFNFQNTNGYFWSSTVYFTTDLYYRSLWYNYAEVIRSPLNSNYGISVRCLKN